MSPIVVTASTRPAGPSTVLRLTVAGEIDHSTAPTLREALAQAIADDSRRLELDLTDVTFFSCAGVTALFGAHRAAGGRLELIGAGRQVRRLLQLLALDTVLGPGLPVQAHGDGR
jgi:anti-sigma B factor antagonist